jgi:hypothetical protein
VCLGSHKQHKAQQTVDIELMLQAGHPVTRIAQWAGVSQQRVSYIKKRLSQPLTTPVVTTPEAQPEVAPCNVASVLKPITLHLTPSVFDALTEACSISNRRNPEDLITIQDYIEELIINRVAELGLLRKTRKNATSK